MEASGTQKVGSVGIKDQVMRAVITAVTPTGRWICAAAALIIGVMRIVQGRGLFDLFPAAIYVTWFIVSGVGLLATSQAVHAYAGRIMAAIAAGAFIMLGMDAIGASPVSGLISFVFAWRMGWEAVRYAPDIR